MNPAAMKPFGLALLDFWRGDKSACITIVRDDGFQEEVAMSTFFRGPDLFTGLEQTALERCRGFVLDAGAGSGRHSLALQSKGHSVCSIDVSADAVRVMREAGVLDCRQLDILEFDDSRFDTVLMMGHGVGMAGDIDGLHGLLKHLGTLLKPNSQVLLDSLDPRATSEPLHLAYHEANRKAGRYFGQIRLQLRYKGQTGPAYGWLLIDPETMAKHALATGWAVDILWRQDDGNYLGRLVRTRE
jgi:SAM-dependent methyltransferase